MQQKLTIWTIYDKILDQQYGFIARKFMDVYSGCNSLAKWVNEIHPTKRVGLLASPPNTFGDHKKFAIDNGMYSVWKNKKKWDEERFLRLLNLSIKKQRFPQWVVVPDVPCDPKATLELWNQWSNRIIDLGFKVAFAAQNGHRPEDIPLNADVVFVGGDTNWKLQNIPIFCKYFKRVHGARINGLSRLWAAYNAGCESIDGNSYWRKQIGATSFNRSHFQNLVEFIQITDGDLAKETNYLFPIGQYCRFR